MGRVAVGVSGGIDSGTALYILKDQGYDVVAVYTEYFTCSRSLGDGSCCSRESLRRARANADMLDVPFYPIDFKKEFTEKVEQPFVESYGNGLTPNPCVWCNSRLRFSLLMDKLSSMGIGLFATGHYAVIEDGRLFRASDRVKDQSYFLYDIAPERLNSIIFPLGRLLKSDVVRIARDLKLPVSDARESQDCCILMEEELGKYLTDKIAMKEGEIRDAKGRVLGIHRGYQNYTIGQRRGLGGLGRRMYVLDILPSENVVIVGEEESLYRDTITVNYTPDRFRARQGVRYEGTIRSAGAYTGCTVTELDNDLNICKLLFDSPVRAPTPGQSAVLYLGDELIGGGTIQK